MENKKTMRWCDILVVIFFLIQPILDVLACFDVGMIHILIRGSFFCFMIVYLLWNPKMRKWMIPYLLAIGMYLAYYLFYFQLPLIDTISNTMKLFYLPVVLLFFYVFTSKHMHPSVAMADLTIYVSLFVLSYLFGFGFNNYDPTNSTKLGFRGVFNSINEISAILIALLPIATKFLLRYRKWIWLLILYGLTIATSLLMGTKVTLGGIVLVILYFVIPKLYRKWKRFSVASKSLSIAICCAVLLLGCYLLPFTTTYQNMVIQAEFFQVDRIFSLDFINRVLFNDRLSFLAINWNEFLLANPIEWIFGVGFNTAYKLVEIDFFDVLFRYGIVGWILLFLPLVLVIWKLPKKSVYFFSLVLLILISCTSGHVLIYPAVAIYFGFPILFSKKEQKN